MLSRVRYAAGALLPVVAVGLVASVALTAGSAVPASRAGGTLQSIGANGLKPAACAALNLNGVRTGTGTFSDNGQPHLVLGGVGADVIRGRGRSDCILGGGGNDVLRGDGGIDVCIGGPGVDTFYTSCETRIQ